MFLISPIIVVVHAENIQDRDRGQIGGCRNDGVFALKALIWADRANSGRLIWWVEKTGVSSEERTDTYGRMAIAIPP